MTLPQAAKYLKKTVMAIAVSGAESNPSGRRRHDYTPKKLLNLYKKNNLCKFFLDSKQIKS
jgi:hypothetical protein